MKACRKHLLNETSAGDITDHFQTTIFKLFPFQKDAQLFPMSVQFPFVYFLRCRYVLDFRFLVCFILEMKRCTEDEKEKS